MGLCQSTGLPHQICHVTLDNGVTNVVSGASKRVVAALQVDMAQVGALRATR